jgi:hypothetical protein
MTTPWSVPREWIGETVAILASGPSMNRETAEAVRGKCRVIAVNNQGIDTLDSETKQMVPAFAPWADVLFAADAKWWHTYQDRALKFAGLKVCVRPNLPWKEIYSLQQSKQITFDPNPKCLVGGGNSGYMALHLAVHFGAKRVLLCGYDMRDGLGKKRHWFGNHPSKLNARGAYATWKTAFGRLAPVLQKMGVEVLNCTPQTALTCFRRVSLQEALSAASRQVAA